MAAIEWDKLSSQTVFDRMVEAFFYKKYDELDVEAIIVNGRGGDAGIDIEVHVDGRLVIYQLKYFPEGFSGGFKKTRQQQIAASFNSALKHNPDEWHLVVPSTLTTAERLFVKGLPGRERKPRIGIFDRPRLDALASDYSKLTNYFQRDNLVEVLKLIAQEEAGLVSPGDLEDRLRRLGELTDSVNPNWTWDWERRGDLTIRTLRAQRSDAAEREPIELRLTTLFSPDHADLQEAFRRAMGFGVAERIDLPAEVIAAFEISGPAFLTEEARELHSISIVPLDYDGPNYEIELRVKDDSGSTTASHGGTVTRFDRGQRGGILQATFYHSAHVTFVLPADPVTARGKVNLALDFAGVLPAQVISSIQLLEDLRNAAHLELRLDGKTLCTIDAPDERHVADEYDQLRRMREIAEDLEIVQRHTRQTFNVPETIGAEDRLFLRCMRLLIDGHCVAIPGQRRLTFTLSGQDGSRLRELLHPHSLHRLAGVYEKFGYEMFGRELMLGETTILMPAVRAVNGESVIEALNAGAAEGHQIVMECVDDLSVWFFLPGKFKAGPDDAIRPTSWGLPEYSDPPDVAHFAVNGPGEVRAAEASVQEPNDETPFT